MPRDRPFLAPVAATTPCMVNDCWGARTVHCTATRRRRRTYGSSATRHIHDDRGNLAETAARRTRSFGIYSSANMQIPGMMIHGRGKYGSTRRQSTVSPTTAGTGRHGHRGGGAAVWQHLFTLASQALLAQEHNQCTSTRSELSSNKRIHVY
jgi:hypothetical protein